MTRAAAESSAAEPPIAPMDLPPGVRRVLLFGGTFDPVHRGHTEAGVAARDQVMGADGWLVFVPAARSPFKESGPEVGDAERLEMLRLALRKVPRSIVWTDELSRPPPSFWVDTLRRVRTALGEAVELRFLIGADQAVGFRAWRSYRQILDAAKPVVMARPPIRTAPDFVAALRQAGWSAEEVQEWTARFVDAAILDISASEIRNAIATRHPRAAAWLEPDVLAFIKDRGLYRTTPRGT